MATVKIELSLEDAHYLKAMVAGRKHDALKLLEDPEQSGTIASLAEFTLETSNSLLAAINTGIDQRMIN